MGHFLDGMECTYHMHLCWSGSIGMFVEAYKDIIFNLFLNGCTNILVNCI